MLNWLASGDRGRTRQRWLIFGTVLSVLILIFTFTPPFRPRHHGETAFPTPHGEHAFAPKIHIKEFVKPKGIKIIGLVFFGRRNRVEMLKCFIERNLVDNGGWLDEVHWVQNTGKEEDLKFLDEILASSPRYKKITLDAVGFVGYGAAWGRLERGSLYVKMDDDVVWFADDSIPRIVTMKIQHPEYFMVSANIINSPLMGWVHYRMGAMHPYLPEFGVFEPPHHSNPLEELDLYKHRKSWHYRDYPDWKGPEDWYFEMDQDPPYDGHRWLRLSNETEIHRTPVADIEYKTWGTGLKSWAIAAQEHYSFLENLDKNNLDVYKFGRAWITDYQRLSINFMTVWADEVLDNLPMDTVDEEWLTINLPQRLRKSVAVESDALAVHFTFGTQGKVEKTDLLERYHDYAVENACARKF